MCNQNAAVFTTGHLSVISVTNMVSVQNFPAHEEASAQFERMRSLMLSPLAQGDEKMLGIIAAVLIVLWLLGFFAFHVTSAFIHAALVVGLILLVLHFITGRTVDV
jgi:uncharacterized membrane protein